MKCHALKIRTKNDLNGNSKSFWVLFEPDTFPRYSDDAHGNYPSEWPTAYQTHSITLPTQRAWREERGHYIALANLPRGVQS